MKHESHENSIAFRILLNNCNYQDNGSEIHLISDLRDSEYISPNVLWCYVTTLCVLTRMVNIPIAIVNYHCTRLVRACLLVISTHIVLYKMRLMYSEYVSNLLRRFLMMTLFFNKIC